MRVFAVSDIHVDYASNAQWIDELPGSDYRDDVLILAGDVSDSVSLLDWTLRTLARKFSTVLFVPGNHELWVMRQPEWANRTSFDKFAEVRRIAANAGVSMQPFRREGVSIVPLLGWYDYSFGQPGEELRNVWMDYRACRWPAELSMRDIAQRFEDLNEVSGDAGADEPGPTLRISFSHFLPRIDVMPPHIPADLKILYPILGSAHLDEQVRALRSDIHIYGHSHVNRRLLIDGVTYINNAFGYPQETRIASKRLLCIHPS